MENIKIQWKALEYPYQKKGVDWFWAVWIITLSIAIASIVYQNILFAILVIIGSFTLVMYAIRKPELIDFEINKEGLKINKTFYPYRTLESFWIQDMEPQKKLLIQSDKVLMPLIIIPLGNTPPQKIKDFLLKFLKEEEQNEPVSHKIMEYLGF